MWVKIIRLLTLSIQGEYTRSNTRLIGMQHCCCCYCTYIDIGLHTCIWLMCDAMRVMAIFSYEIKSSSNPSEFFRNLMLGIRNPISGSLFAFLCKQTREIWTSLRNPPPSIIIDNNNDDQTWNSQNRIHKIGNQNLVVSLKLLHNRHWTVSFRVWTHIIVSILSQSDRHFMPSNNNMFRTLFIQSCNSFLN